MQITESQIQEAYAEAVQHGEKLPYAEYKVKLIEYFNTMNNASSNSDGTSAFLKNVSMERKNVMLPKPPRPGEIIHCQVCGQAMYPKDFSPNLAVRKREFKWHIHNKCFEQMGNLADRSTPGLMSERKQV